MSYSKAHGGGGEALVHMQLYANVDGYLPNPLPPYGARVRLVCDFVGRAIKTTNLSLQSQGRDKSVPVAGLDHLHTY